MAKTKALAPAAVYALILQESGLALAKYPVNDVQRFTHWLYAIIYEESTLNPSAKGYAKTPSGWAIGLSQVTDGTQTDIEKHFKWPRRGASARYEAPYSVRLGAANLAWLLALNKGDWFAATYKYNQGRFAKIKDGSYGNTYYAKVAKRYNVTDYAALEQAVPQSGTPTYAVLKEYY